MALLGTRVKHLGRNVLNRLANRMSSAFGWVAALYASHRRSTEARQQRLSTDPAQLSKDLVAQESAVNTAASRVRGTWVTYLVLWTYLVIAVGSITHRQLFLAEGIKLPVLDVDLPLIGFFWVAPGLFIVMHLYLLLQLRGLMERVSIYETILCQVATGAVERARLRQRLDPYIVLQAVAGSEEGLHDRIYVGVLRFIVWLTVVFAPLGLLFFVQVRFLPYHDEAATWAHRVFIALDLLCLWLIWRPALRAKSSNALMSLARSGVAVTASLAGVFLSVLVLIFPGEAVEAYQVSILSRPVVGTWDQRYRRTSGGWVLNYIILRADDDFIDDEEIAKLDAQERERPTSTLSSGAIIRSFRDRDFRGAVLDSLDLRRTNFANARLQGASLFGARLQGASLEYARLQGASLEYARLQGASLDRAWLQGASLEYAQLQAASLFGARLQGASLEYAQLQGASLGGARLQGASLVDAQLQAASLFGARLPGASLEYAQLQGALLFGAQLQGASLDEAQLQGASLFGAWLQGTSLEYAQLQGASLEGVQLQGASLADAFSWRTVLGSAPDLESALIANIEAAPVIGPERFLSYDLIPLEPESLSDLIETWSKDIPAGDRKDIFLERLEVLRMDARTPEEDGATIDAWVRLEKDSRSFEDWLPIHLEILVDTACNADVDGYVSNGIARRLRDRVEFFNSSLVTKAAKRLLDATPNSCAGAVAMNDAARTTLRDIVTEAEKERVDAEAAAQSPATSDGTR
ncbi:pentapeptide repeat-containing protein [Aurantimonas sp. E1-2-R+4]|uniref:pentapeptide repeat-containing protein n=1 Tax=Aurantimonas sp. E1-2-R+4 TaxID=3113714 RepID=UPI002F94A48D